MFLPKPSEANFETPPDGAFPARCYRFIDLGTQPKEWMGATSYKRMVMLSWELPTELMADGRPFSIHQRFVWSMSEKSTLRKYLESWRGKKFTDADFGEGGFNTEKLIGATCTLSVVHATKGDKTYANIASVSRMMKGVEIPPPINETIYLSMDNFDQAAFEKLSQSMKETIMHSPEFQKIMEGRKQPAEHHTVVEEMPDDSIPF